MIKISEHQQLMESMRSLSSDFDAWSKDPGMLQGYYSILDAVENWRYSTGPIFDKPPFSGEMDGLEGGKLLRKSYLDIYEARLKNVYSSGFIGGNHIATVSPSSPITSPLTATFFDTTASVLDLSRCNEIFVAVRLLI